MNLAERLSFVGWAGLIVALAYSTWLSWAPVLKLRIGDVKPRAGIVNVPHGKPYQNWPRHKPKFAIYNPETRR